MRRVLLGGLLAGIALFLWGAVSHMVLGTLDRSVKVLPNEDAVLAMLRTQVPETGFYIFPGMDMRAPKAERDRQEPRWKEAYARGPRGVLVLEPAGASPNMGALFGTQLVLSLLAGLMASLVV